MAGLPFEGLKVVDFSWVLNGPHIGLWFAALGAEVIKVESSANLDNLRQSPQWMADGVSGVNRSGIFHSVNFSKRSVNLNLSTERGRELAHRLVQRADIVIESYTRPVSNKLGLSYETLKTVKEDIIVVSCSLLGKQGLQQADWSGYGMLAVAFVGECDAQAYPGGAPRQTGGTWPDYGVGPGTVFHLLAALNHRRKTGKGQWLDLAMSESVISWMPEWYMDYFMNGRDRRGWQNRDDIMAPHNTYRCKGDDKWIAIAVGNDREWQALRAAMGEPEWAASDRFADQFRRWSNRDELDGRLSEWTREQDHLALAQSLQDAGVPATPVMDSTELHADPHLWDWGFWWRLKHHEAGERIVPGMPVKMSNIPEFRLLPPPDLGEHNREVLGGILGLSDEEIDRLVEEKIVY